MTLRDNTGEALRLPEIKVVHTDVQSSTSKLQYERVFVEKLNCKADWSFPMPETDVKI